jgi:hypothetical protein
MPRMSLYPMFLTCLQDIFYQNGTRDVSTLVGKGLVLWFLFGLSLVASWCFFLCLRFKSSVLPPALPSLFPVPISLNLCLRCVAARQELAGAHTSRQILFAGGREAGYANFATLWLSVSS